MRWKTGLFLQRQVSLNGNLRRAEKRNFSTFAEAIATGLGIFSFSAKQHLMILDMKFKTVKSRLQKYLWSY